MKQINLTKDQTSIVDNEDYLWLSAIPWHLHSGGYAVYSASKNGSSQKVRMHRLIMDAKEGQFVDHINGDKLDNRKCNLRIATVAQNMRNKKATRRNTSGIKGVSWNKRLGKWEAQIMVDYKLKKLGFYDSLDLAALAYEKAAKRFHGEFARL